jgi:transposase
MWVISKITPEFEKRMLDVLEVYERPYDPKYPVICLDEISKQLLAETRDSLPMQAGKVKKCDYEYARHGTVNLFVIVEPKGKKRYVFVTKHRKKEDFAKVVKKLVRKVYKRVKKVIVVLDNLNTHNKQTLIEVFGEKEGSTIARKIEWHYTPKHGSWLNQAEIENHVLSLQCLNRRIATFQRMQHEVAEWVKKRNEKRMGIVWQFTREKAKKKFKLM